MTDAALVAAAQAGDRAASALLIRRYHGLCWRFAYRMLGDRHDAEDAVQEAFLRAIRALPRYQEHGRFRAWLLRILANRCRSMALQRRRNTRRQTRREPEAAIAAFPSPTPLPDEHLGEEEGRELRATRLHQALARLPPKYREALLLKHGEGLSYEEMSRVTGASIPALKMRVKRACEAARPLLEDVHEPD